MDVTTESRSEEVQGVGVQGPEGNGQSNSDRNKKCLIHSESFKELLFESSAFVDKTLFIKQFFQGRLNEKSEARKILVTAPNWFGKSIMLETLKVFCEPEVDEEGNIVTCLKRNEAGKWIEDENKTPPQNYNLFKTIIRNKPLQIYSCNCPTKHVGDDLENGTCESRQFFHQYCGQHPVIYLSLQNIWCHDWNQFIDSLKRSLGETYRRHLYLGDKRQSRLDEDMKIDFNFFCEGRKRVFNNQGEPITLELDENDLLDALSNLVKYLYTQFGKKVLILIDEFDTPLMRLVRPDSSDNIELGCIEKIVQHIGTMVGNVLKDDEKVLGALINACSLLATTMSSYAGNVSVCSFLENHEFSEYYGLTKTEVADLLKIHSLEGFSETVLSYHNAYRVFGTNLELYNTVSVLKCLNECQSEVEQQRHRRQTNRSPEKQKYRPRSYFGRCGVSSLNTMFKIEGVRKKLNDVITNEFIEIEKPVFKMTPEHVLMLKEMVVKPVNVDHEHVDLLLQYMKDRGYFNIVEKSQNRHVYAIPNGEVEDEIISQFYSTSLFLKN